MSDENKLANMTDKDLEIAAEFYRLGLRNHGLDQVIITHLETVLAEQERRRSLGTTSNGEQP